MPLWRNGQRTRLLIWGFGVRVPAGVESTRTEKIRLFLTPAGTRSTGPRRGIKEPIFFDPCGDSKHRAMAVWACGVAAAARAAATAPGLRLFVLGALGGVAGVWEARESGVWCMRFSAEQRECMHTSGLLGAGGGGAAGAGAGAAGCGELGAGAEAVRSRI